MAETPNTPMSREEQAKLLNIVLKKESEAQQVGLKSNLNTNALVEEAQRQKRQVCTEKQITKSGGDD